MNLGRVRRRLRGHCRQDGAKTADDPERLGIRSDGRYGAQAAGAWRGSAKGVARVWGADGTRPQMHCQRPRKTHGRCRGGSIARYAPDRPPMAHAPLAAPCDSSGSAGSAGHVPACREPPMCPATGASGPGPVPAASRPSHRGAARIRGQARATRRRVCEGSGAFRVMALRLATDLSRPETRDALCRVGNRSAEAVWGKGPALQDRRGPSSLHLHIPP